MKQEEKPAEGTTLWAAHWTLPEDLGEGTPYDLYVSYDTPEDRQFLEDLFFRFSVAHPPQGGTS